MTARSPSSKGLKCANVARLSRIWASSLMPESTVRTPGKLAAKRSAQLAHDAPGSAARSTSATLAGGLASRPPFTGSITTTGLPWRMAHS